MTSNASMAKSKMSELVDHRLQICQSCSSGFKATSLIFCKKCGCCMNIKAKFAWTKCPLDKWPPQ
jgi:rRNA maturation endonuclease Nob1